MAIDSPLQSQPFGKTSASSRYAPYAIALLRIVAAYLFILHGCMKLLHVPHDPAYDGVTLLSLAGVAGLIELIGGALMLVGWKTRAVAFVLSGEMAAAYFIAHAPKGSALIPMLNGGEPAVLYCFVFLLLAATGAGAWSLDRETR